MNLIIISPSCPPRPEPQSYLIYKLFKQFVKLGVKTKIIGVEGNIQKLADYKGIVKSDLETVPSLSKWGYRIINLITLRQLFRVPDDYIAYFWPLYKRAKNAYKEFGKETVLFSFAQPHTASLVALRLKKKYPTIHWVAHFSDPWSDNIYHKTHNNTLVKWLNRTLEAKVMKHADRIVFVTEATRDLCLQKYKGMYRSKTTVIQHCFDPELYTNTSAPSAKLVIRYIGNFYGERKPSSFFEAVQHLIREQKLSAQNFIFECYGALHPDFNKWVKQYDLEAVVIHKGLVSYFESLQLMQSSDVLLVIDAPSENNVFLTSKIIDYLGSRKKILAITPNIGATADFIKLIGDGYLADFHDIETIKKHLLHCLSLKPLQAFNLNVHPDIYNRFDSVTVAKQYLSLLSKS